MSINLLFREFAERICKEIDFKPRNLNNYIYVESKRNEKKYRELLDIIKNYWQSYKGQGAISHLLQDHYSEISSFYLTKIFPFQLERLKCGEAKAPTLVDFKFVLMYRFSVQEIRIINEIKEKYKIKTKTQKILRAIFWFSIASFDRIIETIYRKAFACQFIGRPKYIRDSFPKKDIIKRGDDIIITSDIAFREQ